MNLYLMSQNTTLGWDTFDSCVVAAESIEDAKTISPNNTPFKPGGLHCDWAYSMNDIECTLIGTATPDIGRGVIVASFNAG